MYISHMFDIDDTSERQMTKTSATFQYTTDANLGAEITPPVTIEQLQDDVTNVFLHYVRNIYWMTDAKTAWAITKTPALEHEFELGNPDFQASDLGLTYVHIKDTQFAKTMKCMYDYAYFGLAHLGEEALEYEGIAMWTTALLVDAAMGDVGSEWGSYGLDIQDCAARLVKVAETANARLILEGDDEGFYFFASSSKDDKGFDVGHLNVRQVALLSGMEEMSIRAAANPNRSNQLKPTKTEHGTRFEIAVVKEWLMQKKRYVPITKRWFVNDFDLSKSYKSWDEISEGLDTRYILLGQENGYDDLDKALAEIHIHVNPGRGIYLEKTVMDDEVSVRRLARILSLQEDLLLLRAKEAIAAETLRNIEREIKSLAEQQK